MIWNPHGRTNSGLLNEAWNDARGQHVIEHGMEPFEVYPPMICFCHPDHTGMAFYYADGEFFCSVTKEPLMSIVELEGYPLNFVRDPKPYFDDGDAERSVYDDYYLDNGNHSINYPVSEFVLQISPKMAHQNLAVAVPGEGHTVGGP